MKKLVLIFTVIACMVSYAMGRQSCIKDYKAACLYSDIARDMVDNLGTDAEEIYWDYIDNLDELNINLTKEDLEEYCWCY